MSQGTGMETQGLTRRGQFVLVRMYICFFAKVRFFCVWACAMRGDVEVACSGT